MHILIGNLFEEVNRADLILFTTNAMLKKNGDLVMGAGIARQAAERFPDLPRYLGQQTAVKDHYQGVITGYFNPTIKAELGCFQTKHHWHDPSRLDLIKNSCRELRSIAPRYERIVMNFPGIGKGQLDPKVVYPIITYLPDNIFIYVLNQGEIE